MAKETTVSPPEQPDNEVDISCGIWKFRTNVFGRKFANLYVFTILMSTTIMLSKMVGEIIPVQLKYMQRQFNIDNEMLGVIRTAQVAGNMATLFWAGHFIKGMNIPVVIATAAILEGIALSVPAFLQFMDPYELDVIGGISNVSEPTSPASPGGEYLCFANVTSDGGQAPAKESGDSAQFTALLVVSAVAGALGIFQSGAAGNLYIDDNALDRSKIPILMGIRSVIWAMSRPAGLFLNGLISEVPVDLKETTLEPSDSRFVSAWWLAYFVFGVGGMLNALPLMMMPRRLISKEQQVEAIRKGTIEAVAARSGKSDKGSQGTKTTKESRRRSTQPQIIAMSDIKEDDEMGEPTFSDMERRASLLYGPLQDMEGHRHSIASVGSLPKDFGKDKEKNIEGMEAVKKQGVWALLKDFPGALMRLLKIPQYVLLLIDVALLAIPIVGISMFRSNYMNFEFNAPVKDIAYYSSITTVVSSVAGIIISSWIATKVTTQMGYLWIMFFTYLIGSLIVPFYLLLGCDNQPIYGLSDSHIGLPVNMSDYACDCSPSNPLISCGADNNNYLSPCFAGCKSSADGKTFNECDLLQDKASGNSVTSGLCPVPESCYTNFLLYVILHGVQKMVEEMSNIPRTLFLLRMVDPRDRAFGLSLFGVMFILPSIPAPSIFGKIYDGMCLLKKGNVCHLYDRDSIRFLIGGVDIAVHTVMQTVIVLLMLLTWYQTKKLRKAADEATNADKPKVATVSQSAKL